jgi:hypothetical protein
MQVSVQRATLARAQSATDPRTLERGAQRLAVTGTQLMPTSETGRRSQYLCSCNPRQGLTLVDRAALDRVRVARDTASDRDGRAAGADRDAHAGEDDAQEGAEEALGDAVELARVLDVLAALCTARRRRRRPGALRVNGNRHTVDADERS